MPQPQKYKDARLNPEYVDYLEREVRKQRVCDCPQAGICEFFDKETERCLYGEI